jgi:ribosomal protein S18 acetylase RimI-like enzyme
LKEAELDIRRYEPDDHETVLHLNEEGLRGMGALIEEPGFDLDLRDIEGEYLEGDGEFLVGVCEGQVVAMGALRKTSPKRAEVKRMRVAPAFRGRGFGQRILDVLHRRATALGYATLHLDTGINHEAARNLYEANGYRKTRCGKVGPVECVFYEKSILA